MRRSMLFLPGNTPNMIINGDALGADSIILDLEDAVSPDEKDSARPSMISSLSLFMRPIFTARSETLPSMSTTQTDVLP